MSFRSVFIAVLIAGALILGASISCASRSQPTMAPASQFYFCKCLWVSRDLLSMGFADLHGPSASLFHNIVSGAPPFAPLLLPNLAILGFLGILALRMQRKAA